MIEDFTMDYNRVQASTATEDGDRIVVTLDADMGPTNISLPTSEVPRLVTAITTAAGMATAAQTGNHPLLALPVRSLGVRILPRSNEVVLVVELAGGAEMFFQAD